MKRIISILLFSLVILYALPQMAIAETKKSQVIISFGVGPQQSASELAKRWVPIFQYLSEKTGYDIQFTTAKDIPTYQQQAKEGFFDMLYINPYHYTLFNKSAGYDVFATEKDAKLVGVLVVRKDSPYNSVADLNGMNLAFPSPNAVTATVLPLAHFKENNISVTPNYIVSMDSVYRAVAKGLYPAGGGEQRTFNSLDPEIRSQLRILWSAEPFPAFIFAAHPRVPKDVVKRVQAAMLEIDKDPKGMELLKVINLKGIVSAKDSDYDSVRKLNLNIPDGLPKKQ